MAAAIGLAHDQADLSVRASYRSYRTSSRTSVAPPGAT